MDRRTFLTGAALAPVVETLASGGSAQAQRRLKVVVPELTPEQLAELRAAAPNVELLVCKSEQEAIARVADADGVYGFVSPAVLRAGKRLKWVQTPSAGVEHVVNLPEIQNNPELVLTNMQRCYGPEIADQALGYLLCFTRSLSAFIKRQASEEWGRPPDAVLDELQDKTMQLIGLGGIGSNIARRAHAFGMTVLATDPKVTRKPEYVAELHGPEAFHRLLPRADVLVSAVPLTPQTRKMVGERELGMMKKGVILINVSRGGVVDTDALVRALESKQVAAAGLDVTDPEPLPKGHPLWKQNAILTPHTAGTSAGGFRRA
ncbi:MAG TPA: D-2-hydroxyacid dehydrogenase, partial [Armatimonadota bacterium]|nr:D-2-hydroxyacid dehydrogenase [Armatimonadota bacterium]